MLPLSSTSSKFHPTALPFVVHGQLTIQQGGFTHGFVCEFANAEDRDYYISKDPAHLEFVASLEGVIKGVRVVDYEPGKF